uniref:Xylanase inhibitor C-terminal domain-containing protein n=1 Tax=Nymphaea colorata TaxID=210225 RepID=A0A5K1EWS7_9MAGN|nr:unnamed protein product [Nymphaea colorata]
MVPTPSSMKELSLVVFIMKIILSLPCVKFLALLALAVVLSLLLNRLAGSSIDDKFAYCLPPYSNENNSVGQLKFSEDTEFSGTEEVQETPMASDGGEGSFYVLILTDISVGNSRLNIQFGGAQTTALLGDARSIIIDSGTSLTFIAKDVYGQVANAVANVINREHIYPPEQDLLCYHVEDNADPNEGLLEMTFHFTNADWKLPLQYLWNV